jgi:beta-ribofuranosylaminobenzene 5'-phosphate synthase
MMDRRVRVRTSSRLHFGLLGWGPTSRRQFGGLGLMIQDPSIELVAELAERWQFEGPLAGRAERLVVHLRDRLSAVGIPPVPARIRVLRAPPEHVGLGVGTQVSLAVASAVLLLAGAAGPTAEELALLTGRGDRSGIGLHGFQLGGMIVDGGRRKGTGIPPLVARHAFPEEWSILVVQPPGLHGLHGADEARAFDELPPIPDRVTERLCRIVLLDIIPALLERDLPAFGAALMELQANVGAIFAPAQGGTYTSPHAAAIVEELGRAGLVGIGQSSWGPTLYAFSDRPPEEIASLADRLRQRVMIDGCSVLVTRADNQGAARDVED